MIGICKAEHSLFYQVFGGVTGSDGASGPAAGGPSAAVGSSSNSSSSSSAAPVQPMQWLDSAQQALSGMLESLCSLLSDLLRPMVLVIHDVDTLCELVHILSTEILSETIKRAGSVRAVASCAMPLTDRVERVTCGVDMRERMRPSLSTCDPSSRMWVCQVSFVCCLFG